MASQSWASLSRDVAIVFCFLCMASLSWASFDRASLSRDVATGVFSVWLL